VLWCISHPPHPNNKENYMGWLEPLCWQDQTAALKK
jgi:hypothetical protein